MKCVEVDVLRSGGNRILNRMRERAFAKKANKEKKNQTE